MDKKAIRREYETYSVQGFYERFGDEYRNPHEALINRVIEESVNKWQLNCDRVLDLACGSGEVTLALQSFGVTNITGIDPYTYNAYCQRTGKQAEIYTFEDIAAGVLRGRNYSLIVCSFALHLVDRSRLPLLLYHLSLIADTMVIITPHKRPQLKSEWGWIFLDEITIERVRAWLFQTP
ncbi:methyltransferase domain-containing protein [Phormidium sp. LEGE 05292]|uniref:class I SAM-dependent methyltransferase n=1 Tax=[Phormidium] sp. LEGE 05292 TaxID=767427 RepID=UPI00187F89A4|nr:class I SAM-dependent methyltransferase [Phormidium sp. LEGE 05292]MBE9227768.1 methyltransferase domain-containing protein [Phormidium sp. LEGE 05292]